MKTRKKTLRDYLQLKGLKITNQREIILKTFLDSRSHCSTDDLYIRLRKKHPKIGYATVHRTLKLLVASGIAIEQNFGDGQARYEPVQDNHHHDHLICRECGLIIEFEEPQIEKLQHQVAAAHQFTIESHRHELYGLCSRCSHLK
ncbi:ferric uptake regulator, Fur family [Desulfuromusa kysingii]|uniref:Ferric uptake regulation protein n=1 Tax=Desulfuromusa kysingii TaxID=37625 RepID=A0A1H3VT52_9BACT|nr:transcriptional repressor [Desulfuromusa kysingii]SDZ78025.1 ferric uptake regulator, Fur family [Desulfuromusa kysingii]